MQSTMKKDSLYKAKKRFKRNEFIFIWGGLTIPLISWVLYYWYVNFSSFVLAFQDMSTGKFTLGNFQTVFESIFNPINERDSLARGFKNTMGYFLLDVCVEYPIHIFLPYFLYKRIPGHKTLRYLLLLPSMIPGIALASVYKIVIEPNGILERIFGWDIPPQGLLNDPNTATSMIMIYKLWITSCGCLLLYGGAMSRIPVEILESTRMDGIKPFRELISIILPLIWPTVSINLLMTCCQCLNANGPILLLSPNNYDTGTTTIAYWIFSKVYNYGTMSDGGAYNLASAAGLLLTLVVFPLSIGLRKMFSKIPTAEY